MIEISTKRGPGRPRKVAPDGSVVAIEADARVEVEVAPVPFVRVRVTHYKVLTSQGRYIEGQFAELPADEAADLVAQGLAKPC